MFLFVWIPLAAATVWCGLAGAYIAIRNGTLSSAYLTAFGILSCLTLKVDHYELGAATWRLSFYIGVTRLSVGINFLAIAYLVWLSRLRAAEPVKVPASLHPTGGTESNVV